MFSKTESQPAITPKHQGNAYSLELSQLKVKIEEQKAFTEQLLRQNIDLQNVLKATQLSKEIVSGLLARDLNLLDHSVNSYGYRIFRCNWNGNGLVIIRESKERRRESELNSQLRLFKSKLHSFSWYIQTLHFSFRISQRTYLVHEYHPITLREFIQQTNLIPIRLAAKMFACIVRGVHAFNITKTPLTRLSPSFIVVTGNLIPKLGDPEFQFDYDQFDDALYRQDDDGLSLNDQAWNLSLVMQELLGQKIIEYSDDEMAFNANLNQLWGKHAQINATNAQELLRKLTKVQDGNRMSLQDILNDKWMEQTIFDNQDGLKPLLTFLDTTNAKTFNLMLTQAGLGYEQIYQYTITERNPWQPWDQVGDKMNDQQQRIQKFMMNFDDHKIVNFLRNKGLISIQLDDLQWEIAQLCGINLAFFTVALRYYEDFDKWMEKGINIIQLIKDIGVDQMGFKKYDSYVFDAFFREHDTTLRPPPQQSQISWQIVKVTRTYDPEDQN